MMPRHFGMIPKSARREPIKSRSDFDFVAAVVAGLGVAVSAAVFVAMLWFGLMHSAHGRERYPGQFAQMDDAIASWFRNLMQPDNPTVSCCGEADAYYADSYAVSEKGEYIAIITDERDDAPLGRIPRAPGTKVTVPNSKIKFDRGNPTGRGVVFIGGTGQVLCYVPPGGV